MITEKAEKVAMIKLLTVKGEIKGRILFFV